MERSCGVIFRSQLALVPQQSKGLADQATGSNVPALALNHHGMCT